MNLPYQSNLPINRLAAIFSSTSATYKFYWFLAIIGKVEHGNTTIAKRDLFIDMVAQSWFTVNYFHISFGKQDQLQKAVERIKLIEGLTIEATRQKIIDQLTLTTHKETSRELQYFNAEVPHRFLSPWFKADNANAVCEQSQFFTNDCLYALFKDHLEINPAWVSYLQTNALILKHFCYWNLAMYLQAKNPNVPDIPNKLFKVPIRKALVDQRRKFWDIVFDELGSIDCIYTNRALQKDDYAVEHFVPYAFVSHDLIWNLIPADRSFNSSKSDKLPVLDSHFTPFFNLQQKAFEIISLKHPKNRFLEDYLPIFPNLTDSNLKKDKFFDWIQPLVTIASNNGFEYLS